ncbi:hypothetical protein KP509_37G034600 [Ceratopteris richardii]|uniref:Transmembrane protein n=1 Tax=Ceratopteris richardii TaxID=49495 RepID=A0A8T2Q8Z7_CERRI|nr:hypothetical protein KP509_37G034600 [Ceratopteris richardii]
MLWVVGRARIGAWFQYYENLQSLAVILLYIQVGCSLIGSLGVSYVGLLLANLAFSLLALVAIESRSQVLTRIYAVLLMFSLIFDVIWLILFSVEIRHAPSGAYPGKFTAFSLNVVLLMQISGFIVRFVSAFVWLKMYRMGIEDQRQYHALSAEGNFGRVGTFGLFSPISSPRSSRHSSHSDEVLGGSVYNPNHYSSQFSPSDETQPEGKVCGRLTTEAERRMPD